MGLLSSSFRRREPLRSGPPTTLERVKAVNQCVQSFLGRDWDACIRQANDLAREHASLQIIQILLISLQRIPHDPNDAQYRRLWGSIAERALTAKGFDHILIRLTLRQVTLEAALHSATNENERCKAYYYAGAQKVVDGELSEACAMFREAVNLNVAIWERDFAEAEGRRTMDLILERDSKSPRPDVKAATSVLLGALRKTDRRLQPHPKPMNMDAVINECAHAFVQRDYTRTIQCAEAVMTAGMWGRQIWLMLLTSLLRLGREGQAQQAFAAASKSFAESPFAEMLGKLLLGQSTLAEVLLSARDEKEQCQAHYWEAARLLTEGYQKEATDELKVCLAANVPCAETKMSAAELRVLNMS